MADITEVSEFTAAVPELGINTAATGGTGGPMNSQAQALANRTKFLNDTKVDKVTGYGLSENDYSDAEKEKVPTTAEKAHLATIEAATGTGTAAKITALIPSASTTVAGKVELATAAELVIGTDDGRAPSVKQLKDATALADFWLTKRMKMPDGATAVSSQDAWATAFSFANYGDYGAPDYTTYPGRLRVTRTGVGGAHLQKALTSAVLGKDFIIRYRSTANVTVQGVDGIGGTYALGNLLSSNGQDTVARLKYAAAYSLTSYMLYFYSNSGAVGDYFEMDWYWIGDYSYLDGSQSEEATRIADQLGDTPGVGAAATATITSNGINVNTPAFGTLTTTTNLPAADSTFKVGTKTYTWKSSLTPAEGEVLLEATVAACLTNARDAVNGTAGTLGTKHQCTANTLFTATASATILTVTAILRGTVGNGATYEIVAGAGSELTASGALATGGVDNWVEVGGKRYTWKGVLSATRVEGELLVGPLYTNSMIILSYAINRYSPATYDYNGSSPIYNVAAANPLVYGNSVGNGDCTLTAGTATGTGAPQVKTPSPGILGNQITIAKSAATLTLSGATLAGGKDAVGDKIHTQLQTMPATTAKYGAALLAADGGTTPGTVVQANDSRLMTAPATWTPSSSIGGVAAGVSSNVSTYLKSGKLCHLYIGFTLTKAALTGSIIIGNLPVVPAAYIQRVPISILNITAGSAVAYGECFASIRSGSAIIDLQCIVRSSGEVTTIIDGLVGTTHAILFDMTYITA